MGTMNAYENYQQSGGGALPWVDAGLKAAGILSSLYGNYNAQENAMNAFEEQKKEYQRQEAIAAEQTRQALAQQALQNKYTAKGSVDSDADQSLARYAGYFRNIGL